MVKHVRVRISFIPPNKKGEKMDYIVMGVIGYVFVMSTLYYLIRIKTDENHYKEV